MSRRQGIIHNGVSTGLIPGAPLYAQTVLRGAGTVTFGNKPLRFDASHVRIFAQGAEIVPFASGICLTMPLALPELPDEQGQTLADVRLPMNGDLVGLVRQLALRFHHATLPCELTDDPLVRHIRREIVHRTRVMRERIDQLPGRALYKRVDTYLRLERARDYLETHYLEDPSTQRLSEEAAISRAHFIRLFGSFYGTSPKQRVLELKLDEAERLLSGTELSIWEVAEAAGFGNRCAFQRMFRHRIGVTPGRYREDRART